MSEQLPLAIVTGASTGIGLELARVCGAHGYDLVIAADEPAIEQAAEQLRQLGVTVTYVEADLATTEGVDKLYAALPRVPDVLMANAGRGLGHAFLDREFTDLRRVVDTNITGTIDLIHRIGRDMRARGEGRILITGSIAGFAPGTFNAVYNATKSFIDSFSIALNEELKDTGVTVTCLMPGATQTDFFRRADLLDTKLGTAKKDDPADVAKTGFEAMLKGEAQVVSGFGNKVQVVLEKIAPAEYVASQHRKKAEPGGADK